MVYFQSTHIFLLAALLTGTTIAERHEANPGQSDSTAVPETCSVTKPPDKPFVPPSPYPKDRSKNDFWFGTTQLWTILPANGTWNHLGHYTPDDPTFRVKMFWWHEGYDYRKEPNPELVITGRRLDGQSPILLSDHASNGWTNDENHPFMVVAFNLPTLGCWEIKGRYHDAELKFVIWVTQ